MQDYPNKQKEASKKLCGKNKMKNENICNMT